MTERTGSGSVTLSETLPAGLVCPACLGPLRARPGDGDRVGSLRCGRCSGDYEVRDGVPDLIHPPVLSDKDRYWQGQYDDGAEQYDQNIKALSEWLDWSPEEMEADRRRLAEALGVRPGFTVLEVSVGSGANLPMIAEGLEGRGCIVALDISRGMLEVARRRAAELDVRVDFLLANASHLPFADSAFDAVLHIGGINEFGERRRAFEQMVRVAKPGARIVVADESIPLWHRGTARARRLIAHNKLYLHEPPFEEVPWDKIESFHLDWVGNEVYYVFGFRKRA